MSELSAYWKELKSRYSHLPEWTEALTHKSFSPQGGHYEKWELLGDAVLDLAIIDLLLQRYPQLSEGELSKKRAALVNQSQLASLARQLGLEKDIRLGVSELKDQGANKDRILASVVEAILGVVYRTQGWAVVFAVTQSLFAQALDNKELSLGDYKTELQELTQKIHKSTPEYQLIEGKDSAGRAGTKLPRVFRVQVSLQGRVLAQGEGLSRKQAEQQAARVALEMLKNES
ncbi:MAG: ribonuclease III [Bdellovibrionaceae bacterium]|jgi:ribonuclease-3|nr:ribonuclease III [Pseudobdellovibrionaceae bacterium]